LDFPDNSWLAIPLFLVALGAVTGIVTVLSLRARRSVESASLIDALSTAKALLLQRSRRSEELEHEARLAQQQFQSAFDHAPIGMALVSPQGRWLKVNSALCAMLGYSADDLVSMTFQQLTFHEDLDADIRQVELLLAGRADTYQMEKRYLHRNGALIWASLNVSLVRDDAWRPLHFIAQIQDISSSKRAEIERAQRAREAESARELLDAVVGTTPSPLWVKDEAGRWLFINEAATTLIGCRGEDVVGRTARDIFPADAAERIDREDLAALQSGGMQTVEGSLVTLDGRERWGIKRKFALTLRDGRRIIVGSVIDLTEQRAAQRRSEEAYALLNAVFDNIPVVVSVKDEDGRIVLINAACAALHGKPVSHFIGKTDRDLFSDEQASANEAEDHIARQSGETLSREVEFVTASGSRLRVLKRKRAVRLPGDRSALLVVLHDITPLVRVREDAEYSRKFLDEILDLAPQPLFVKDEWHRWVVVNKAFCEQIGHSKQTLLGSTDADCAPAEWAAKAFRTDDEALRTAGLLQWEENTIALNGRDRWIVRRKQQATINGERFVVGMNSDITDLKIAQEELRRHRDHLQELVELRTAELREVAQRAEAASRAKSEFLANMSHELRTPMHAVLSFAHLAVAKLERPPISIDKLQSYMSRIEVSGARMLALIDDLLDLAKAEAGRLDYAMQSVDLGALIRAEVDELHAMAMSRTVTLEFSVAGGSHTVHGDSKRLAQVVRNLLSNSIKFTPQDGRVHVHLEAMSGPLCTVRCAVEDSGVGIPQAELQSIFDKFEQSTRTRNGAGGTGLGLAIAREIVTAHGGTIWAEQREKGGARVCFELPAVMEARHADWAMRAEADA